MTVVSVRTGSSAYAEAKAERRLPVSDVLTNATMRSASAAPTPQPPEHAHGEMLVGLGIRRGDFNRQRLILSTANHVIESINEIRQCSLVP